MLPVSDPVNRGLFYGGEVLVTSVIVQVNGVNGWAMVMDEGEDLAFDLAVLDGGYAAGIEREEIEDLVGRARGDYAAEMAKIAADVAATRVSFDLM
jgi:alpha-D-ribose 1-methylphosphonate 5-triphosphate synthase subunit PhnG